MNIGRRPTFAKSDRTIEVHVFDFQEDIYDEIITIDVVYRIREEHRFESLFRYRVLTILWFGIGALLVIWFLFFIFGPLMLHLATLFGIPV